MHIIIFTLIGSYTDPKFSRFELMNDYFILFICYWFFTLTDYVAQASTRFNQCGVIVISVTIFDLTVNLVSNFADAGSLLNLNCKKCRIHRKIKRERKER